MRGGGGSTMRGAEQFGLGRGHSGLVLLACGNGIAGTATRFPHLASTGKDNPNGTTL